jgi:hypothetical protein
MAETLVGKLKRAMRVRDDALSAYRQHKMAAPLVQADDEMNRLAGDALPHMMAVVDLLARVNRMNYAASGELGNLWSISGDLQDEIDAALDKLFEEGE